MASTGEPHDAHRAYLEQRHFGSLDGLRALSVAGTVWHHTTVGIGWAAPAWFGTRLFGVGALGVQMFFAISGFLITTLLLREHARNGRISFAGFYKRRALRIFPAYYLTIALYVILALTLFSRSPESRRYLGYLPSFVTYTENWLVPARAGETLFVQAWSLSTEEQFYLVWPLILALSLSRRRGLRLVAAGALLLVMVKLWAGFALEPSLIATVLTSIALPICFGAMLASALHSARIFERLHGFLGRRWSAPLAATMLLVMVVVGAPGLMIAAGLALVVGTCACREDHSLSWLLRWRPASYVGQISYGIYLYHLIMLWLVKIYLGVPAGPVLFLTVLVLTIWMAAISYRFFEVPFLKMKRRISDEAPASPSLSTA